MSKSTTHPPVQVSIHLQGDVNSPEMKAIMAALAGRGAQIVPVEDGSGAHATMPPPAPAEDESKPKKRGRPKGSKNKPKDEDENPAEDTAPEGDDTPEDDAPEGDAPEGDALNEDITPDAARKEAVRLIQSVFKADASRMDDITALQRKYDVPKFSDVPDDKALELLADARLLAAGVSEGD